MSYRINKNLEQAIANHCQTEERLFYIVKDLIEENIRYRTELERRDPSIKEMMSPFNCASEFKTISVGTHRRAGHTYVASELTKDRPNSVLLLPTHEIANHARTKYPILEEATLIIPSRDQHKILLNVPKISDLDLVIVDNYNSNIYGSCFNEEELWFTLNLLSENCNAIVFLGS